ncbi:MAG: hypothetical protein AB1758_34395, partial [Candidatus Eremiobacterota bacterium]
RNRLMDQRHRQLCIEQAQSMLEVASITEALEAYSWSEVSRQEALRAASWLREQAGRIRRRVESESGDLPLGRLRVRTLKLEKLLNEMANLESRLQVLRQEPVSSERILRIGAEIEGQLEQVRVQLRDFLEEHRARRMYDELAQVLRDLTDSELRRGQSEEAERYRDLARRFEARLDAGEFDRPRPREEEERDRKVLEYFQELLDERTSAPPQLW